MQKEGQKGQVMITDYYLQTSTPATYPVTLVEVKLWLRITHDAEDDLLNSLITAATEKAEKITNRVFIERTYTGNFSGLDCSNYDVGFFIALRRAPLIEITLLEVTVDDSTVTIYDTDYNIKKTGGFPRIVFEEVSDRPDLIPYPYQVAFTAGYGAAAVVPEPIKTAIKEMIAYWYQNRGDCGGRGGEIPAIADGILQEYRIVNTFGC
jgi:uncharacterized phiE125 gp8 family phage protein